MEHIIDYLKSMDEPEMAEEVANVNFRLEAFADGLDHVAFTALVDACEKMESELAEQTRLVAEYKRLFEEAEKQEPFAVTSGYFGGHCVIAPLNSAHVVNVGLGLYAAPIPAQPVSADMIAEKAKDYRVFEEPLVLIEQEYRFKKNELVDFINSAIPAQPAQAGAVVPEGYVKLEQVVYEEEQFLQKLLMMFNAGEFTEAHTLVAGILFSVQDARERKIKPVVKPGS